MSGIYKVAISRILVAVAAITIAGTVLLAQNTAGSISGVVQDSQGAVVPNAKIVLVNSAQGAGSARELNSSGEGTFVFSPVFRAFTR